MASKTEVLKFLRNLPDDDALLAEIESLVAGFSPPYVEGADRPVMRKPREPQFADGKLNPAFLVELRDIAIDYNMQWQNFYGHQWPTFQDQISNVTKMAQQAGIDLSTYAPETFSISDIESLDSIFEATTDQLKKLEQRILHSHELGLRNLDECKKKAWASCLRRTRKLQGWCRSPLPPRPKTPQEKETWRYLHPIRYMLYTMRSHLMTTGGHLDLMEVPIHLIRACMVMKCAQHHASSHEIKGVLLVFPPRHGKTTLAIGDAALEINLYPHLNNGIIHHNADHARRRQAAVKEHFDDELAIGRRRRALFPNIRLDPTSKKSKSDFFVLVDNQRANIHQEGNSSAWGVHSQAQGITLHKELFDDPSDQKEQAEEGTRERTNNAISATWLPRLTGRDAFFKYICTRWHPEDFCGVLLRLLSQGKINVAVYSVACGGPDENFAPIWPNAGYDSNYLAATYARLGSVQYAMQYQNNPDSPASRRVRQLRYYPAHEWTEPSSRSEPYARFFNDPNTTYYLSCDPSGTDSKYSNLAGITFSAFGLFRTPEGDVPRLLFLDYWSLHASQHDISRLIADFYRKRKGNINRILVETTSGFHATAEDLIISHDIPAQKVFRPSPGQGSKLERLLKYAIHLECGDALFPGTEITDEHGDTTLQIDDDWIPVSTQILQAGTTRDNNLLDCVRQQLAEVSPDIYRIKGLNDPNEPRRTLTESQKHRFYADLPRPRPRPARYGRPRNHLFATLKSGGFRA